MLELLLVLGSLVGFCVIALITVVVTPQIMIELGLWVLAVGLLVGIPTGLWYHVVRYSYPPLVNCQESATQHLSSHSRDPPMRDKSCFRQRRSHV